MRYSAKPGNPSKSSIHQVKLYSVAVKTAVSWSAGLCWTHAFFLAFEFRLYGNFRYQWRLPGRI